MKKFIVLFLFSQMLLLACKEQPIIIPSLSTNPNGGGNTSIIERKLLIEEYTGAGCVNCPDGAAILQDLAKTYGKKLILVSIHAGFFTTKAQLPKESKLNFVTAKTTGLQKFLGEPLGYPAAVFNRKTRDAGTGTLISESKNEWAAIVQQEVKTEGNTVVLVKNTYDAVTRKLQINVEIKPNETLTGDYALTLMLTEDAIVDAQKTPSGTKVDYAHRHVLRDILTATAGAAISESLQKGTSVTRSFEYQIPDTWKAKDCEVVAVFHKTGASKEVVQAEVGKVEQ